VPVEKLHKGPFGIDPIACRIGRMTIALRTAQAAAIAVRPRPSE
jgi:ferrous iron transport protein A